MDYGDGKLNGVYQFNTKYRKGQICRHLNNVVGKCNGRFIPVGGPAPTPLPTPPPTPPPTPTPTRPPTPHPHCICVPALHPSDYTKCYRGDDNRIRVTHETTHIVGHDGLENQHVCREVKGKCQCCDCVPQLSLSSMASDIRMLPRGTYTIEPPFLANGQHNIK